MSDQFLGEIRIVGFTFAPVDWAFCDGQIMSINQNTALFSLLGTFYGGNGTTTFALPNLQGCVPMDMSSNYPLGFAGGEDSHALIEQEMPVHSHTLQGSTAVGKSQAPAGNVPATVSRRTTYAGGTPTEPMAPGSIGVAGSNQSHENRAPFLNIYFIIALVGIFPERS